MIKILSLLALSVSLLALNSCCSCSKGGTSEPAFKPAATKSFE